MSQELHVFMETAKVPDRRQWQAAINTLALPLELDPELNLAQDTGFSPCKLNGEDSGFEIYPNDDAKEILSAYPRLNSFVRERNYVITFRWSGDVKECGCVLAAAAGLVKCADAVAFSPEDDIIYDIPQLLDEARHCI